MEMISIEKLKKIEKHILKINNELDYLDPFDPKDNVTIIARKKKLKFYIDLLTPKSTRPIFKLIKNLSNSKVKE